MPGAWLDVHLVGKKSNRNGLGAQIRIGNQTNPMTSAVGYASFSLTPVHCGGLPEKADLEIRWPSGFRQVFKGVATSRTVTIAEE